MGQRKRTVARPDCAGKRATLMAEELATRQFGDDPSAVEDDELVRRGARFELVDEPRDQLCDLVVVTSSICLAANRCTLARVSTMTPIATPSRSNGTPRLNLIEQADIPDRDNRLVGRWWQDRSACRLSIGTPSTVR
jgi:hypothetical protein